MLDDGQNRLKFQMTNSKSQISSKLQCPNSKQIPKGKSQFPNMQITDWFLIIGNWSLNIEVYLRFEY